MLLDECKETHELHKSLVVLYNEFNSKDDKIAKVYATTSNTGLKRHK